MGRFVHHVQRNHFIPNTVLVDCTADSVIAGYYHDWLRKGIHVVTPNKKANSGPLDQVPEIHTSNYERSFVNIRIISFIPKV